MDGCYRLIELIEKGYKYARCIGSCKTIDTNESLAKKVVRICRATNGNAGFQVVGDKKKIFYEWYESGKDPVCWIPAETKEQVRKRLGLKLVQGERILTGRPIAKLKLVG